MRAKTLATIALAGMIGSLMDARAPAQQEAELSITAEEFKALYQELHPKGENWATIPWKVSVTEARSLAARARKPIFLVINTGNCLGFV